MTSVDGARLDELASRYGIVSHQGFAGERGGETKIAILATFGIDAASDAAIEAALEASMDRQPPEMRVPPAVRCHVPQWLGKAWGLSAQLYEIRSRRNWGIGDFEDLAELCRLAAKAGADFVGINPLHALFVSDPARCSPFSPSNRLFLNPLYIAVDCVPGYISAPGEPERVMGLRKTDEVDYVETARLKMDALRRLWRSWAAAPHPQLPRAVFDEFRGWSGEALAKHVLFEALSARMATDGSGSGWRDWPHDFQNLESPAVQAFASANGDEIEFHAWLQWIADMQLGKARASARDAGMRIGLYLDFAVGEVPDGSASWSNPAAIVPGMLIGAPPDVFAAEGQEWGLAPVSPVSLVEAGFAAFRRTMEAMTRHAGALRIDHVMSLWQLFFVPEHGRPADGAYVRYPLAAQIDVLAELSQRDGTMIIGEDLGIVPPGFREVMQESRILSYRILYFEKQGGDFSAPELYPVLALACLSTHDLPTFIGWWRGHDIELRLEHGLIDEASGRWQLEERTRERQALIELMARSGALAAGAPDEPGTGPDGAPGEFPSALVVAAHRLIAATPCLLASVRLADLTGEDRPTNLPGTVDAYPNWRLKSSVYLEELTGLPLFREITAAMAAARPK
jgi:4-alpha-glucanotransferase